jgi:sporulation protein YlmC with PRC-barrel domain
MLSTKNLNSVQGLSVYTDAGEFFGIIEEAILNTNKVDSWKVKATARSYLSRAMPGAKGVILPHHHIKAIGDVVIISRAAAPIMTEE